MRDLTDNGVRQFGFRPWVRRAGLSIVLVASGVTIFIVSMLIMRRPSGWAREPFVWVYIGTLWIGGLKVFLGTLAPIATVDDEKIVLRPLHQLKSSTVRWVNLTGTEQSIGGDRLIVYHDTARGMRFVALNLNLVKGRRELLQMLDKRMRGMGFIERTVERSRYLSRPR